MYVDIHSHIIPGVDDGAADEDTALEMLKISWNNGTGHIVATPHYIDHNSEISFTGISERCKALQKIAADNNLSLAVHAGCEVFLGPDLPDLFDAGDIFTINQSSYMLIELPMASIPNYTDDILYKLQLKGVVPIIAHPERNKLILRKPNYLADMVSRGILAQINSGSITGLYGHEIQKMSIKLIKMGIVHFAGSDAHTCNGRSPRLDEAARIVEMKFGSSVMKKLFTNNGLALLKNDRIEPDLNEAVRIRK